MAVTFRGYFAASAAACAAAVAHAALLKEQFFLTVQFLAASRIHFVVCGNFLLALAFCAALLLKSMFFGTIRRNEETQIYDRLWYSASDTLLAFTMFRATLSSSFFAQFAFLVGAKLFHFLVDERLKSFEQNPQSATKQLRVVAAAALFLWLDVSMIRASLRTLLHGGITIDILFAFEFGVLASLLVSSVLQYLLFLVDMASNGRFESKGMCVFVIELLSHFVALCMYASLFGILFSHFGFPVHLVRDVWLTFTVFVTRMADFIRYRRIVAAMDSTFPSATDEDLAHDATCIVCQGDMTSASAKKLQCGHSFHRHCLLSWLERKLECPLCRTEITLGAADLGAARRARDAAAAAGAAAAAAAPDAPAAAPPVPGGGVNANANANANAGVAAAPGAAAPLRVAVVMPNGELRYLPHVPDEARAAILQQLQRMDAAAAPAPAPAAAVADAERDPVLAEIMAMSEEERARHQRELEDELRRLTQPADEH